ncbi:SHOCT domain-containing protein [Desulfosporosinus metallidurans]|nr:SHOCT domain-containing protein [Desulfosporosinus metallidurans]
MMHGGGNVMRGFGQGYMTYGHGWMGFLPLVSHLIFFIVVVVLAVIFMRRHGAKIRTNQTQNDPALKILRERYAQGEIDTEEFNQRKQDLSN